MVNRGCLYEFLLLVGLPLTALITYFGFNYSGFCFAQMRYLSDEEKIRRVFDYQNSRNTLPIENFSGVWYPKHIKYNSFDEYIALYPDCCSVNPGGGYEVPPAKFLDRIFGYDSRDIVVIYFQVRYLDENNSLKIGKKRFDNYLTNCGKPR
ncbi:MAG: hypothetical protein QNJ37_03375 [Crocosphaera sp.]|nr:hypothetical protein [Crocosphaera sp.]